jgi:hypothetical protein
MSKAKTKVQPKTKIPATSKAKAAAKASKPVKTSTPKAKPKAASASSGDWRVETLSHMRSLILGADPQMVEERKWVKPTKPLGVPVWSHDGIVCTGETYQKVVKLTFMRGASLPDPTHLFNSSLEGGTRRAIDIPEGGKIDARAFKALIKAAVAENGAKKKR